MPASRTGSPPDASSSSMRTHICGYCSKAFSTSGHLSRHVRVHTGEMNYSCSFPGCTTRCSRKDNLRQHYRLHFDVRDPEELRRQAPHKKRRKTRVQRVATIDATVPGGVISHPAFSASASSAGDSRPSESVRRSPPLSLSPGSSASSQSSPSQSPYDLEVPLKLEPSEDGVGFPPLSLMPMKSEEESGHGVHIAGERYPPQLLPRYGMESPERERDERPLGIVTLGASLHDMSAMPHASSYAANHFASPSSASSGMYFSSPSSSSSPDAFYAYPAAPQQYPAGPRGSSSASSPNSQYHPSTTYYAHDLQPGWYPEGADRRQWEARPPRQPAYAPDDPSSSSNYPRMPSATTSATYRSAPQSLSPLHTALGPAPPISHRSQSRSSSHPRSTLSRHNTHSFGHPHLQPEASIPLRRGSIPTGGTGGPSISAPSIAHALAEPTVSPHTHPGPTRY
ncbi:hypothetical protein MKEN_00975700 [Mycena kentingensis (nom. inval.)]|nr:hypothetical protein MKEN_00975700 [Mycena kentingensis (nom. inval.)]